MIEYMLRCHRITCTEEDVLTNSKNEIHFSYLSVSFGDNVSPSFLSR
jgi:hypothetical protein